MPLRSAKLDEGLQPQYLKLTLSSELGEGTEVVDTPVLAPYEVLHWLQRDGDFARSCLPTDPSLTLEKYWQTLLSPAWAKTHPLFGKRHLWQHTLPIAYFTDGAGVYKASAAEGVIYSWSSIVADGIGALDSRFLAAFVVGDLMVPETR